MSQAILDRLVDSCSNDFKQQNAKHKPRPIDPTRIVPPPAAKPNNPFAAIAIPGARPVFTGQLNRKKQRKIVRLEQWIEVHVVNGKTVTTLYPSNERLMEKGQAMLPPPEYVYRRICFPNGVPAEYNWTEPNAQTRQYGGLSIQRLTVETWLEAIEKEKINNPEGHLRSARIVPRPEETGGCDCPACTGAKARIAREGS